MNANVASILSGLALGIRRLGLRARPMPGRASRRRVAPVPGPLPLFPPDNWWNLDISTAPVDPGSASYIAFINNGGTRRLHPDFGGEASPGQRRHLRHAVRDRRRRAAEAGGDVRVLGRERRRRPRDGRRASRSIRFPRRRSRKPHWVEGGAPGNVDQRSQSDRHLLIIDCTNRHLYELYNVYFDAGAGEVVRGFGRLLRHGGQRSAPRHAGPRPMPRGSRSFRASCATTRRGIRRSPTSAMRSA